MSKEIKPRINQDELAIQRFENEGGSPSPKPVVPPNPTTQPKPPAPYYKPGEYNHPPDSPKPPPPKDKPWPGVLAPVYPIYGWGKKKKS